MTDLPTPEREAECREMLAGAEREDADTIDLIALDLLALLDAERAARDESVHAMHMRVRGEYDRTIADSWRAKVAEIERERDEAIGRERAAIADSDRWERAHDTLLADWREVEALPAVHEAFEPGMRLTDAVAAALADSHYAEGTPLFDAEIAKREAEAERDEAQAEREKMRDLMGRATEGESRALDLAVSAERREVIAQAALVALREVVESNVPVLNNWKMEDDEKDAAAASIFDALAATPADLAARVRARHRAEALREAETTVQEMKHTAANGMLAGGDESDESTERWCRARIFALQQAEDRLRALAAEAERAK